MKKFYPDQLALVARMAAKMVTEEYEFLKFYPDEVPKFCNKICELIIEECGGYQSFETLSALKGIAEHRIKEDDPENETIKNISNPT